MPQVCYIVCATPRSGSTLLCELLKGTGVAGVPEEYFEARADTGLPPHPGDYLTGLPRTGAGIRDDPTPPDPPEYSGLAGIGDYREHLERSFRLGTTPNGVFGTKLMWRNLDELHTLATRLPEYAGLDAHELLDALFAHPRYVWMTRRDKLRQAISLWRALQTRTWRLEHPGQATSEAELHFSYEGIEHLERALSADDAAWGVYLERHGRESVTVVYEDDLEIDQARTIARVLAHIGIEPPADWRAKVTTFRQADQLTERWVAQFLAERERRGPPEPAAELRAERERRGPAAAA
jgi:LPS sulfotransferase NodH